MASEYGWSEGATHVDGPAAPERRKVQERRADRGPIDLHLEVVHAHLREVRRKTKLALGVVVGGIQRAGVLRVERVEVLLRLHGLLLRELVFLLIERSRHAGRAELLLGG